MPLYQALEVSFRDGTISEFLRTFFRESVPLVCPVTMQTESFADMHEKLYETVFKQWETFLFSEANQGEQGTADLITVKKEACGHLFRQNEPCFTCVQCATDPTCVLCRTCFLNSEHVNHKYHMHSSSGNGYCDCGDPEAWTAAYHCRIHQPLSSSNATTESGGSSSTTLPTLTNPFDVIRQKCEESGPEGPETFFQPSPSPDEIEYMRKSLALLPPYVSTRFYALFKELLPFVWELLRSEVEYPDRPNDPLYQLPQPPVDSRDFCVYLYNDEKHTFEQVEDVLTRCVRMSKDDAIRAALVVDRDGRSIVIKESMTRCADIRNAMEERSIRNTRQALRCETWHVAHASRQDFACHVLSWLCELVERFPPFRFPISIAVLGLSEMVCGTDEEVKQPLVTLRLEQKSFIHYFIWHHSKLWKNARNNITQFVMSVLCQDPLFRKLFGIHFTRGFPTILAKYVDDDHSNVDNIESVSCQIFTVISLATYLVEQENVCTQLLSRMLECLVDWEENGNFTEPSLATIPPHACQPSTSTSKRLSLPESFNIFLGSSSADASGTPVTVSRSGTSTAQQKPIPKRRLFLEQTQEFPLAGSYHLMWHRGVRIMHCIRTLEYILRSLQDKAVLAYSKQMWRNWHAYWKTFLSVISFGQDMIPIQRAVQQHVEVDTQVWSGLYFLETLSDSMTRTVAILSRQPDQLYQAADVLIGFFIEEVMCAHSILTIKIPLPPISVSKSKQPCSTLQFPMVECVISRDYVSLFQPLPHVLAMVLHYLQYQGKDIVPLLKIINNDLSVACAHIIERPLRVFVITGQTIAGLWTLNGFTVAMLGNRYYSAYMPFIYWNLALLQQMACYMEPDQFLAIMLHKFELEKSFGLIRQPFQNLSKLIEVAVRFFTLLYQIISHRFRVGVGVGMDEEYEYRDILLHVLCAGAKGKSGSSERSSSGGMTHSQIQAALAELQLVDEKDLDVHLLKVADEREHGGRNSSPKIILFEPKVELLKEHFTPYHFIYLPRDSVYAEEVARKRLNDASGQSTSSAVIPPLSPRCLTKEFAHLSRLTGSQVFVLIVGNYLQRIDKQTEGQWWNHTGLELLLHIIATALYDDERQIEVNGDAPFLSQVKQYNSQMSAQSAGEAGYSLYSQLKSLLSKLQSSTRNESVGLVKWVLQKWRQVSLAWVQKQNPSLSSMELCNGLENIDECQDAIADRESEELRKHQEREERKERMLRLMAERQRHFLEAAKAKFGDFTQNESESGDEDAMEVTPGFGLEMREPTTLKNMAQNMPPVLSATSHTCILCQSQDEEGNIDRPLCVIANVARSSVLSLANHKMIKLCDKECSSTNAMNVDEGLVETVDVDSDLSDDPQKWRHCRIYQPAANNSGAPVFDFRTDRPTVSQSNPPEGTIVVSCGHVAHHECIEKTKVSTARGNPIYVCSLCKRVGHCLLFLLPPSLYTLPPIFPSSNDLPSSKKDVVQLYCRPCGSDKEHSSSTTMTDALLTWNGDVVSNEASMSGYNLWLSKMFEWYSRFIKNRHLEFIPPSDESSTNTLLHFLVDSGRLMSDNGDLIRLRLAAHYNTNLTIFYNTVAQESVVESLWPSQKNHWSAVLPSAVPPLDVAYTPMPQCLVYTLSVWERQLRAISADRNFFNCLEEYQTTFLRALCRNTFLLHEPIFDVFYYPHRAAVEGYSFSNCSLENFYHWKEHVALWSCLDTLFMELSMVEGINKPTRDSDLIQILEVDCLSLFVALLHSRHTQMEILLPHIGPNAEAWSRAVACQLAAFAVRISFTFHLVQIILSMPLIEDELPQADLDSPLFVDEINDMLETLRPDATRWKTSNFQLPPAKMLSQYCCNAMLPFLRMVAYIIYEVTELQPQPELLLQGLGPNTEIRHLLSYLGLPLSMKELFLSDTDTGFKLVKSWCNSPSVEHSYALAAEGSANSSRMVIPRFPLKVPELIELPNLYTELIELTAKFKCSGKSTSIFLCLMCGRLVCSRGVCCMPKLQQRPNVNRHYAGVEAHSQHYHNGYAIMLNIFSATIHICKKGVARYAPLDAPYRDQYGEKDRALKRGNPLFLHKESYEEIQKNWLSHQYILYSKTSFQQEDLFQLE